MLFERVKKIGKILHNNMEARERVMLLYAFQRCKANHNKVWLTDLEAKFDDKLNICYLIMERWINKGIIHY